MRELYDALLNKHGPQGWWPTRTRGYTPGDYSNKDTAARCEVSVGAILTQNTNWGNVQKALDNLHAQGLLNWKAIAAADEETLQEAIRPSGYYRQKARKLKEAAQYFLATDTPTRAELLDLWGVGPETADSILCYAYGTADLVVDAYLRRVLKHHGYPEHALPYEELKTWTAQQLPETHAAVNEFHALIVAEGKSL